MLSGFAEKKETLFDLKNRIFKSPNNRIFPKGLTMLLVKKCFFFFLLDLVKIRLEIMLNCFKEKKKPFLTIKNRIFQS